MEHGGFEDRLLRAAPRRNAREEAGRDRVVAGLRRPDAPRRTLGCIEGIWNFDENPSAVAGARVTSRGASMREVGEDLERPAHDVVRRSTPQRGNEPEPAGVVLE